MATYKAHKNMDITVVTAFLSPFVPFLIKLGDKAAEESAKKLGEDGWNKAKAIWSKLHPKLKVNQDLKVAFEQVAAKPQSKARQAVLEEELEKLMNENPELAKVIAKVLQEDAPDGTPGTHIVQNATGNYNQVIGQTEESKVIGTVKGNPTM
jgi:transketolase